MKRFWCNGKGNFCDEDVCHKCEFNSDAFGVWIEVEENPYWQNICGIAERQRNKGISTYGQGLEANTKPNVIERINYIEEELIDTLMYLEWLKEGMKKNESN